MAANSSPARSTTRCASIPSAPAAPVPEFPYYEATFVGAQVRNLLRASDDVPVAMRPEFARAACDLASALAEAGWNLAENEEGTWFVVDRHDGEHFPIMYI